MQVVKEYKGDHGGSNSSWSRVRNYNNYKIPRKKVRLNR